MSERLQVTCLVLESLHISNRHHRLNWFCTSEINFTRLNNVRTKSKRLLKVTVINKIMKTLPAATKVFSVIHMADKNGRKSPFNVSTALDSPLTTEMLESWPTQDSLFPDEENATLCTQPPAGKWPKGVKGDSSLTLYWMKRATLFLTARDKF